MKEYAKVEARIAEAIDSIPDRENVSIAELAREFDVPHQRLRRRLKGTPSKMHRAPANRKLDESQELGICLFIDGLCKHGLCVNTTGIRNAADFVLSRFHTGNDAPPVVGPSWAKRFLERHPEYTLEGQLEKVDEMEKADDVDKMDDAHDVDHVDKPQRPVTPPEQTGMEGSVSMPYTVRSLKRLSEDILAAPVEPSFRYKLQKLMKGSLAQATAGVILQDFLPLLPPLPNVEAAEASPSPSPCESPGREIGHGRPMYVHELRALSAKRRLEEAKEKEAKGKKGKKRVTVREARKVAIQQRQQNQGGSATSETIAQE